MLLSSSASAIGFPLTFPIEEQRASIKQQANHCSRDYKIKSIPSHQWLKELFAVLPCVPTCRIECGNQHESQNGLELARVAILRLDDDRQILLYVPDFPFKLI